MQALRLFYNENELVVTATRHPKPVSQVAENITIISSDEIDAMNAHTVADILDKIPGLFLSNNRDFGAYALINLQGSEPRHTLVLVDDIPWNSISERSSETITTPVGIIDRIEIIKGPASSAWGSSLGGVINIITKTVGDTEKTNGSIYASYGKSNSQDYQADLSGKIGKTGYYLYAGALDSDGLIRSRYADNKHLYSKIEIPLSQGINSGLSIGYSDTDTGFGDYPDNDLNSHGSLQSFFVSPFLTARGSSGFNLRFSAYYLKQKFGQKNNSLGLGLIGEQPGELYLGSEVDEESWGAKYQLVWQDDINTVVFGMDLEKGEADQSLTAGSLLQGYGVSAVSRFSPDNTKWAIYVNDTLTWGKWSVIPGIRYDHESVTGSFVSPSLGITYVFGKNTVLRGTIARGFSFPSLLSTSAGGLFLAPNPSLESEEIWSYQMGVESAFPYLWVKANVFFHDMKNTIIRDLYGAGAPTYYDLCINDGKTKRKGLEIEAESYKFYNMSLKGGISYVDIDLPDSSDSSKIYSYFLGVKYKDNFLSVQLFGYYNSYDFDSATGSNMEGFIWDLNINREIINKRQSTVNLFAAVHNLFNGFQYSYSGNINPERWIEAGIKFEF